jgi:AMP deaminase
MSRAFYSGGGPPDPIQYLRRMSSNIDEEADNNKRRSDSADDINGLPARLEEAEKQLKGPQPSMTRRGQRPRQQDPPARERPAEGQPWPYRDTLSFTRSLTFYGAGAVTHEHEHACKNIQEARALREKYVGGGETFLEEQLLKDKNLTFKFGTEGVVEIYHAELDPDQKQNLCVVPNIEDFHKDYSRLVEMVNEGAMRSFCFQRLQLLSTAFRMHHTMNGPVEMKEQSSLLGTDFYRTLKIDNHIHAAAAPSAKQFVDFVRTKLETEGDTIVNKDGKTLSQLFQEAGLDTDHLTIDAFDVLADYSVYQRFDNFNSKYSPFRMAAMRRIFLKTTNEIEGRFFAELLKIVLNRHETSKGHTSACEMRLSIYGMERHEWKDLADWMLKDWGGDFPGPVISSHNRWLIQIPRLWRIYHGKPGKDGRTYLEMLENIFTPMFEATLYPDQHPEVAEVLKHIVGFDSVDDEGAHEVSLRVISCCKATPSISNESTSYYEPIGNVRDSATA